VESEEISCELNEERAMCSLTKALSVTNASTEQQGVSRRVCGPDSRVFYLD
jgi:hypothetical protein